jgi:hypothetical protein
MRLLFADCCLLIARCTILPSSSPTGFTPRACFLTHRVSLYYYRSTASRRFFSFWFLINCAGASFSLAACKPSDLDQRLTISVVLDEFRYFSIDGIDFQDHSQ